MKEGWHNDDYLILFEGQEVDQKQQDYDINRLLPGYSLLGLVGWDDFLVMEAAAVNAPVASRFQLGIVGGASLSSDVRCGNERTKQTMKGTP